jgi:YfiH family protein
MHPDWLVPDWPAPSNVHAGMTTRSGGVSLPPYDTFNPASHVGDNPNAVNGNRSLLRQWLPAEPLWLNQVHGVEICQASPDGVPPPCADASVTTRNHEVLAVLTADCLPVLFCNTAGSVVAAAHAGWRGLAAGVLENTVAAMRVDPETILAWMGVAIGPRAFEVGDEVREAFIALHPLAGVAFRPALPGTLDESPRKWLADLYALARIRLASVGVTRVYGGGLCSFHDPRFFSYRRQNPCGRMASLIWLDAADDAVDPSP